MKLYCFFFLDIFFMRDLNLFVLDLVKNIDHGAIKICVVSSIIRKGLACRTLAKKKKKTSSRLSQT
jgi:hypothetical protein